MFKEILNFDKIVPFDDCYQKTIDSNYWIINCWVGTSLIDSIKYVVVYVYTNVKIIGYGMC